MATKQTIEKTLIAIDKEILNGENHDKRELVRKILNYPAMMVPSVQESIIKAIIPFLPKNPYLFDPFMGAANSLVAGMKYGFNIYGQDINPLSILIGQVKTCDYNTDELREALARITILLKTESNLSIDISFTNINKWFKIDVQIELSKLRRLIMREENLYIRKFFWIALAEVIRTSSNDRTSTFKLHIRSAEEIKNRKISPINVFINLVEKSIADIEDFRNVLQNNGLLSDNRYVKSTEIKWGNSKDTILTKRKYDLLLTSPPYGDNHTTVTYGQFSYLPLQWIPTEDIDESITMDYLKSTSEIDSNSLGGKKARAQKDIETKLFSKSETLQRHFDLLLPNQRLKAGKILYFINDLDISIDNIIEKMAMDSYQVWTIGNRNVNNKEVKNDKILIELLEGKGLFLVTDLNRDILSKRMPGRNNFSDTMNKEKILIFKKPF